MDPASEVVLVVSTAPDAAAATEIARVLLEERLIACVTLLPGATSIYRWDGEMQQESEVVMLLKTRRASLGTLFARATELHPYDVPELIAAPIERGLEAYCRWIVDETTPRAQAQDNDSASAPAKQER